MGGEERSTPWNFWWWGGGGYHLVPRVLTIFQDKICFLNLYPVSDLGQVIQRVDNDIPWINHCQVDKWYQNKPFYLLEIDLSGG